ncbi:hypothetical protein QBC46DRAFT_407714 [Diplogelasinospora grovesii]|uniref:Uncharacterized protein n=1 Tax=Diplogelasinospora grovesii TaxID=303347 RepID=A0AAN6N8D4_9PEZI|nr:hypothetical protein QBC46DRAFT_407714 [Diplogelasinospora grovesii]
MDGPTAGLYTRDQACGCTLPAGLVAGSILGYFAFFLVIALAACRFRAYYSWKREITVEFNNMGPGLFIPKDDNLGPGLFIPKDDNSDGSLVASEKNDGGA